jgi:hypothetical protein
VLPPTLRHAFITSTRRKSWSTPGRSCGAEIEPASDAARRSLVLKTDVSKDDRAASLTGAVVCPGHPGSNGIGWNGTESLVRGTGVLIWFTSQEMRIR